MVWWIVGGIVVLALVGLVVVLVVVAVHLRQFAGVAMTVNTRIADAQRRFEPRLLELQAKAEVLQTKMLAAEEKAANL